MAVKKTLSVEEPSINNDEEESITSSEELFGSFGRWQANITLFYFFSYILTTFNNLGFVFQSANTDHKCIINGQVSDRILFNSSFSTPEYLDFNPSTLSSVIDLNSTSKIIPISSCDPECVDWHYNNSIGFESTITSKFNLICGKEWLRSFSQSMYQMGYVFSGLIIGWLSDKYGRKYALKISIVFELLGGFILMASQNAYLYIAARFILGFGDSGRSMCLYMLIMETVGKTKRADVINYCNFGWVLGYVLIPVFAYFLRNYILVQLFPTLSMTLMALFWLPHIPESPRWLISNKQMDKAKDILRKAYRINRNKNFDDKFESIKAKASELIKPDEKNINEDNEDENQCKKFANFWQMLTNRRYGMITLILWYSFFVNGFIYHGFSLNIEIIGGNMFINFAMAGLVEIPSVMMGLIGMRYVGRKVFIISIILAATLCYATIATFRIMENLSDDHPMVITLSMLGKMFIFATFNAIYIHSGEIFPTKLRQSGVSSCSIAARIGSTLAPFVKDLTSSFGLTNTIIIFSSISLASAIGTFFLPETKDRELIDSIN